MYYVAVGSGEEEIQGKWWVLAQPLYSQQGNGRQYLIIKVENTGIDYPVRRRTWGTCIVKG